MNAALLPVINDVYECLLALKITPGGPCCGLPQYVIYQHHLELKACSQKRGNVANIRSSKQGAKKLQF